VTFLVVLKFYYKKKEDSLFFGHFLKVVDRVMIKPGIVDGNAETQEKKLIENVENCVKIKDALLKYERGIKIHEKNIIF